jgi:YfiH family protein
MDLSKNCCIRPAIFDVFGGLAAAQSTRHGGVSPAPWNSMNLGKSTDDNPENVAENRRRFCAELGFAPGQLAWSKQVHGDQIRTVTEPGGAAGFDALITQTPGILLAVSVADCTPVLIYDPVKKVLAAIHAGWRGTVSQIVYKTLARMEEEYGVRARDCHAYIGACIDECSFEVGEEVAVHFDGPFKRFDPQRQKFFVDLKRANADQCLDFGLPEHQIEISPYCTLRASQHFFSHRADKGITGRGMAVLGMY